MSPLDGRAVYPEVGRGRRPQGDAVFLAGGCAHSKVVGTLSCPLSPHGVGTAGPTPTPNQGTAGEVRDSLGLCHTVFLRSETRTRLPQDCCPQSPLLCASGPQIVWEGRSGRPRRDEAFARKPGPGTRCPFRITALDVRAGAGCSQASGTGSVEAPTTPAIRAKTCSGHRNCWHALECVAVWPTVAS